MIYCFFNVSVSLYLTDEQIAFKVVDITKPNIYYQGRIKFPFTKISISFQDCMYVFMRAFVSLLAFPYHCPPYLKVLSATNRGAKMFLLGSHSKESRFRHLDSLFVATAECIIITVLGGFRAQPNRRCCRQARCLLNQQDVPENSFRTWMFSQLYCTIKKMSPDLNERELVLVREN